MKVKIFDCDINVRDYYCQRDDLPPLKIERPYINIYTTITNACPATCSFCCNQANCNKRTIFDLKKFKEVVEEINSKLHLRKISFTGGEPTLHMDILSECLKIAREANKDTFTVVNTNGMNLAQMANLGLLVDSISLSRHHYDDEINKEIFGLQSVPLSKDIAEFPNKKQLHISCNLMKDYIGNADEVQKFLEWVASCNCRDVGFVSLMKINDYCKEQFVDFSDIDADKIRNMFITKNWCNQNLCRCRNYQYIADNAECVGVYARYYVDPSYSGVSLLFDGEYLREGFGGKIIY